MTPARCRLLALVTALLASCAASEAMGLVPGQAAPPQAKPSIRELIEQLGDADFARRQRAEEKLAAMGFDAYDAVEAATRHEDFEIAARARYLLSFIRMHWTMQSDPDAVRELLADYEFRGIDERLSRIRALARLENVAGLPALCRLVRFEKSELLSKHAAIEALNLEPADENGRALLAETLRNHLGSSPRPAAQWLLAYLDLRNDPDAARAAWAALVESEQSLLQKSPGHTSPQIVATLLYHLAEVQAKQGVDELAETTARQARQLSPGNHPEQLLMHLQMAGALQRRGLFRWAEAEYRQIIEAGVPEFAVVSQRYLAEMWHDQSNDAAAAESLRDAVAIMEKLQPKTQDVEIAGQSAKQTRARMYYFESCRWEEQGDRAKQIDHLEKALKDDPAEIDALIACWRLPEQSQEFRQKIGDLIDRAASELRQQAGDPPEDANACNQYAWLVGNTKGDSDDALSLSLKSVEMNPTSGAFHDTLAHVYFGRGDYEKAVKTQTRAAELDPHSGLIRKQLEVFQAALKKQQAERTTSG